MGDNAKQFMKRLTEFSVGPVVSAVLSFIIVPVTTNLVSPEDFGKSAMYTMGYTISYLFIFLGLDQAFVREYNEHENKNELFWNALIVPLVFSFVMAALYVIFYEPVSALMFGSSERYIVVLLAVSLPFAVLDRFNMLVFRMEEKAKLYSMFNIINKILALVILVPYLMYVDRSFKGIINATFINLVLICIIEGYFVVKILKISFKINKGLINKMLRFGFPLIPATVVGWFLSSMDRIALRQWSTFEEIGIYSAAFKIITVLGIVQSAFSTFWAPTAYRWHKENVPGSKYMKVSSMLLTIMALMFSVIVLLKDIIVKLLSADYLTAAGSIPFLLFFPIMYTVSETTTLGIPFSRKTSYNIIVSVTAAVINYGGNYLLVPKYGAMGSSIATGISYIIFFWMRTLISRRLWFRFDLKPYIVNTFLLLVLSIVSVSVNNAFINTGIVLIIVLANRDSIGEITGFIKPAINKGCRKILSKV